MLSVLVWWGRGRRLSSSILNETVSGNLYSSPRRPARDHSASELVSMMEYNQHFDFLVLYYRYRGPQFILTVGDIREVTMRWSGPRRLLRFVEQLLLMDRLYLSRMESPALSLLRLESPALSASQRLVESPALYLSRKVHLEGNNELWFVRHFRGVGWCLCHLIHLKIQLLAEQLVHHMNCIADRNCYLIHLSWLIYVISDCCRVDWIVVWLIYYSWWDELLVGTVLSKTFLCFRQQKSSCLDEVLTGSLAIVESHSHNLHVKTPGSS